MYYNIFFETSHTTYRMSFNFTLNRGAFVLEILSPGAGVWDIGRPWAARNLGHVAYATLGDPPRRWHISVPLSSTILLHAAREYLRCLAFARSRSRSRSRRRGHLMVDFREKASGLAVGRCFRQQRWQPHVLDYILNGYACRKAAIANLGSSPSPRHPTTVLTIWCWGIIDFAGFLY